MKTLASIIAILFVVGISSATIRTVSPNPGSAQYQTLNTAYTAAVIGDTIVVGPGTYGEIVSSTKRLHWIGAGWDVCNWSHPGTHSLDIFSGGTGTIVEGFRMAPATYPIYLRNPTDSITVRRCLLVATGAPCIGHEFGRLTIEDCVLHSTVALSNLQLLNSALTTNVVIRNTVFSIATPTGSTFAITGVNGGVVEIYNCTFLNQRNPFNISGIPQVIGLNNIFYDWVAGANWGTLPVGSVFEYTARDNTGPAFTATFANNIDLAANNPFVNYSTASNYVFGTSDLHLNGAAGGLACTNTGYPTILDLDGSRSDVGLYGGPKPFVDLGLAAYPFALTLTIDNLVEVGDSVSVSSTGRIGPRY
jgi:hypothetical protein